MCIIGRWLFRSFTAICRRHEQAVAAFRTALSLEPDKPEHTHGLASALEAGDSFPHDKLKEALILYTTAAKVAPNSPLFHMDLCSAAFKLQEFKEASQVLSSAFPHDLILLTGRRHVIRVWR